MQNVYRQALPSPCARSAFTKHESVIYELFALKFSLVGSLEFRYMNPLLPPSCHVVLSLFLDTRVPVSSVYPFSLHTNYSRSNNLFSSSYKAKPHIYLLHKILPISPGSPSRYLLQNVGPIIPSFHPNQRKRREPQ